MPAWADNGPYLLGELLGDPVHPRLKPVAEVSEPGCLIVTILMVNIIIIIIVVIIIYHEPFTIGDNISLIKAVAGESEICSAENAFV